MEQELANLRSLVSAGRLREAVTDGEVLLREFPQEYEVNDLVAYARGEVAQPASTASMHAASGLRVSAVHRSVRGIWAKR